MNMSDNIKRFNKFCLLNIISIGLFSCMAAENKYFEYEYITLETDMAKFIVRLEPTAHLVNVDGVAIEEWRAPYSLSIQYQLNEPNVQYGDITNVNIKSIDTEESVYFESLLIDYFRSENLGSLLDAKIFLGFSTNPNIPSYENYNISFDYEIFKEEGVIFEEGTVDFIINTNYYEAKRRRRVGIL